MKEKFMALLKEADTYFEAHGDSISIPVILSGWAKDDRLLSLTPDEIYNNENLFDIDPEMVLNLQFTDKGFINWIGIVHKDEGE